MAVERLRGSLSRPMGRALPPDVLRGAMGAVRVVRRVSIHDGPLDASFHQIRQNASDKPAVPLRLLEAIVRIAELDVPEPGDRSDVTPSFRHALADLEAAGRA